MRLRVIFLLVVGLACGSWSYAQTVSTRTTTKEGHGAPSVAQPSQAVGVTENTEVVIGGNATKSIKNISVEKEVYVPGNILEAKEEGFLIHLVFDTLDFKVTSDQLFFVEGRWKKASELQAGDKLSKTDGSYLEVRQVNVVSPQDSF